MVEKMSDLGQNSRASNALTKRQEAVKRWKLSDTAKEPPHRHSSRFRICFDNGTVFLSAIASADLDEAQRLLEEGVDINFANVDGLTALHQACIDENLEMVEMLVKNGADIEATDNEGWTCLHAAASAGNVEIAQYLIDNGADLLAVNNEGEVPIDLAEEEEMEVFLQDEIEKKGIEVDAVRDEEERKMLEDANCWLNANKVAEPADRQGATSLHVAAAKGYLPVMNVLIQAGADVNARDNDGWTPLHAAVHWAQKQACETLVDAGADFAIRNGIGQTPCDIAEGEMIKVSEELRKKAKEIAKDGLTKRSNIIAAGNGPPPMKRRISSDVNDNDVRSSICRIKDKSLGLADKQLERKALESLQNSGGVPSEDAQPVRSAMKGARKAAAVKTTTATDKENESSGEGKSESEEEEEDDDDEEEEEDESEIESSESEPEPEPPKKPEMKRPPLPGPMRPGGPMRPTSTASTPPERRTPSTFALKSSGPLRPSQILPESSTRSDTSRLGRPTAGSKRDDDDSGKATQDVLSRYGVQRPGRPSSDDHKEKGKEETTTTTTTSRYGVQRPGARGESGDKETSRLTSGRATREEAKDATDTKDASGTPRKESKAEELRIKFNVMRPGTDTTTSASTNRFRSRRESDNDEPTTLSSRVANRLGRRGEEAEEKREVNGGEDNRKQDEESSSAVPLRSRTTTGGGGYQSGNTSRLSRTFADKDKTDTNDVGYLGRRNRTSVEEERPKVADDPASSLAAFRRNRQLEREKEREAEKERERVQKEKEEKARIEKEKAAAAAAAKESEESKTNDEDDDNSNLSAQRARRSRKPRERRRATGVAYMPDEEEQKADVNDTKKNTRSNEVMPAGDAGPLSIVVPRIGATHDNADTPRLSVAERLKRSSNSDSSSSSRSRENIKVSIDSSDPKELKKRLEETMTELQNYRSKLDEVLKDKERLEKKLKEYDEEIKKIHELKTDNVRLKDENGALIRVISKLSRTPPTS